MLRAIQVTQSLALVSLISLMNLSVVGFTKIAQSQEIKDDDQLELPERRKGGGGRPSDDICNFSQNRLTALIPKNLLGMTAANSPKLFFYIPQIPQSKDIEFVLRDQNDQLVYEKILTPTEQAGIMSFQIPQLEKSNSLKANEQYHWYLSVICNAQDRSKDVVVEGLLERVAINSTLATKLSQAPLIEKVKLYQQANLWQDAITTLVALKRSQPNDSQVIEMWNQLLQSANLDLSLIKEPLIN